MVKITITSVNTNFVEVSYNDLATNFDCSNHTFNKADADLRMNAVKDSIIVTVKGTSFTINTATLAYIETTATTIEDYYIELKGLLN